MRKSFNLDKKVLDSATFLIHGVYGAGKTHLLGDFLSNESKLGPVKFINVRGEDGMLSLAGAGLGDKGETVETVKDLEEVLEELRGGGYRAVGIDSFKALCRVVMEEVNGGRMPEKSDYIPVHWVMERLAKRLRGVATYVMAVCPSDKSVDHVTGRTAVTPDLPGREAWGSAGWFDFVGYLTAEVVGLSLVKRELTFAPALNVVTRARLPKQLIQTIPVPNNGGGWVNIVQRINQAMA